MLPQTHSYAKASFASIIMCTLGALTWSVRPTSGKVAPPHAGSQFSFEYYPLTSDKTNGRTVRKVNKSLDRVESWISAVGAAVAINDLDGDGLANDVCTVDPRSDTVTIAPAPGTPERYKPFFLTPGGKSDETTAPMGCLPGDFNEDGHMDVLVYYWGRSPIIFSFLKSSVVGQSFGPASYVAQELTSVRERWYSNAAVVADFDGDGHPDILIANYFPDGAEILDVNDSHPQRLHSSMSHAFNGGDKHFFLANAKTSSGAPSFREVPVELINRDGTPMDRESSADVLHGWTLAVAAADLNNDLLPEVYLANDFGPDRLLENVSSPRRLRFRLVTSRRHFFTPKSKGIGTDSYKGMGVDFADINSNGKLDILVSNITDEFALEESNFAFVNSCSTRGAADLSSCFSDQSEPLGLSRSGWGWDIKAGDFDNSGLPQIVQATGFMKAPGGSGGINRWPQLHETAMGNDVFLRFPSAWHDYHVEDDLSGQDKNHFFVRQPDGGFADVSTQIGLRHDSVARGIAIADVDGDGRLDFAIANQWGASDFYHNVSPVAGVPLSIRLLLPFDARHPFETKPLGPERDAVYAMTAQVTVSLPGGRRMVQQVNGGNGHSGKNTFDLHFGLGSIAKDSHLLVDLRWRDRNGDLRRHHLLMTPGQYNVLLGA